MLSIYKENPISREEAQIERSGFFVDRIFKHMKEIILKRLILPFSAGVTIGAGISDLIDGNYLGGFLIATGIYYFYNSK
jgi:hypothetical protein